MQWSGLLWLRLCLVFQAISLGLSDPVPLFTYGENGYPCIRVPSMIKTNKSLLAFAGSRCGGGDGCNPKKAITASKMDLLMKRSMDNGKTWSSIRVLYSASCDNRDHGTPVYDATRNRIVLVTRGITDKTYTLHSDDDGETWSTPVPINLDAYNTSRPSPGRGLQLSAHNPHAPNRLVFVAQTSTGGDSAGLVYWTDDGGVTWTRSQTPVLRANEAQLVELSNGDLLMNARLEVDGIDQYRLFSISKDGGVTWDPHGTVRHDLAGATCFGATLSIGQDLLYSHGAAIEKKDCPYPGDRCKGTVWVSTDDANSWTPKWHIQSKHMFAYSCMSPTFTTGLVGLAYESDALAGPLQDYGCDGPTCRIMFTTFHLDK